MRRAGPQREESDNNDPAARIVPRLEVSDSIEFLAINGSPSATSETHAVAALGGELKGAATSLTSAS